MSRKITTMIVAITLVIGITQINKISYAEPTDDLQDIQEQRDEIKEDVSEAEAQITTVLDEINVLNEELDLVNRNIVENEKLIEETEQKIENTIEDIRILQEEIVELEEAIEKRSDLLKERMSSYQKSGGSIGFIEVIFSATSFTDFISRVTTVNRIAESDASLLEQLDADIQKVEENRITALEKLDELNTMQSEQEETLAAIEDQKAKIDQSKESLSQKQQELNAFIEELQSEDEQLASLAQEVQQSIKEAEEAAAREAEAQAKIEREKNEQASSSKNQDNKETSSSKDEKTFKVTATAYTVESAGGSGITATGINLKKNPDSKVIAVDPSVIPLGSVVHVEGYGYAIAGDIGGAIVGNKIDVFVPTQKEAVAWGVRTVKVTVQ